MNSIIPTLVIVGGILALAYLVRNPRALTPKQSDADLPYFLRYNFPASRGGKDATPILGEYANMTGSPVLF